MKCVALDWIVFHEFCHLAGGHVDYDAKFLQIHMITEANSSGTGSADNEISQAFELEADTYAAVTLFARFFGPDLSEKPPCPLSVDPLEGELRLVTLLLTSITAAVKIFNTPLPEYKDWGQATHPPDGVRRVAILGSLENHLRSWGHAELVKHYDAVAEMLEAVDGSLHELLGYPPLTANWYEQFSWGGNCETYASKLREVRMSLQPEIAEHSFFEPA
jgi:hypothetical protein